MFSRPNRRASLIRSQGVQTMKAPIFAVFAVVLLLPLTGPSQDAPKSDLEGAWTGVSLVTAEGKKDDDYAATVHWTITGDKLTYKEKLGTIHGAIRVDAKKQPKTFDAEGKEGILDFNWVGIYERKGDTLTVCYVSVKGR